MKKKKVKINFVNLFIVLAFIIVIAGCAYYVYDKFIADDNTKTENVDKPSENKEIKKLTDLGYSKKEAKDISEYMKEKDIVIDKKYDYLADFIKVKYFHIENIDRYISLKENSDYDIEEVVMRVNTDLDHDYYTNIRKIENPDDSLVLVNKYHALPDDYEPSDLISVGNGQRMKREAGEQMKKLLEDINNAGLYLQAQSGYRSIDTQRSIYNRNVSSYGQEYTDTVSARPTHSEHHTGLAMDLSHDGTLEKTFENTEQFRWLQENAHKYGFIMRYPEDKIYMTGYDYEPWHYRYVGVEIATLIKNEGITYEEYCVKYLGLY